MNNASKHARNDNRDKQADDGPDKEHLKLIQFIILNNPDLFDFDFKWGALKISILWLY